MIIDSITLTNFRQYKGVCPIEFSTDPEKNVTCIIGANTCGKTTLVQAFVWCLYGHTEFKDKKILNAELMNELQNASNGAIKTASVVVRLNHNESNYIIERKEQFTNVGYGKVTSSQSCSVYDVDPLGKTTPIREDDSENAINEILPENLSDYFFFWGERIETLSEKSNLTSAVRQFLGLDILSNAMRHLGMARNKLRSEIGGAESEEIETKIGYLQSQVRKLEAENKKLQNDVNEKQNNINFYEDKANEYYEKLTTSENVELQSRQKDYDSKRKQLETKRNELINAKRRFAQNFNDVKNYVYFFANSAEKEAVRVLRENPEPVVGWNYIDLNAINEIIKKKKCVCGNEFCEGDETHKYLITQRNLVAPNVIGGAVNSFVEEIERRDVFNKSYYDLIHDCYKKINELSDEILDLEFDVEQLKRLITGKSDMRIISKNYQESQRKKDDYIQEKASLLARIKENENKIELYNKNIITLSAKDAKLAKKRRTVGLCEDVLNVFNNEYASNESALKERLFNLANENFKISYNGERRLRIDDNYKVTAENEINGKWVASEPSPGLETVKNFSFITALVSCAKEKIVGSDGSEEEANKNSYPLVLDAPFSKADENHVPAISKLIAKNAEQIILVVMKKDWEYAKDALADKVGKSYTLRKITETHTVIDKGVSND